MDANVAQFVGSIPQYYDAGLGPLLFHVYATEMARRVAAHNPKTVLETATGTGIVTRRLRDLLPSSSKLTATDLNLPMLDVARTKFGAGEQIEFAGANAIDLPFGDASFDAVVCQFGMMFFPDKPKSYREAHRVLAPGGKYFISVWDSHAHNSFARIGQEVSDHFFPDDPPQFYRAPFSCHAIDPVKAELQDAGFADIDIAVLPRQAVLADAEAFGRAMIFGNPLIDQIKARGGVDPEAVVTWVVSELRREFGPEPSVMPMQIMIFTASKPG